MVGIILKLIPEMTDVDIDNSRCVEDIITPNTINQLITAEDLITMVDQIRQQLKFLRGQLNRQAILKDL